MKKTSYIPGSIPTVSAMETLQAALLIAHALSNRKELLLKRDGTAIIDGVSLSAIRLASGSSPCTPPPSNIFKLDGRSWMLRYDEAEILLPDSVGLSYIHQLLQQQGNFIQVTKMVARRNGEAVECLPDDQLEHADNELGHLTVESESRDEIVTQKNQKVLMQRIRVDQAEAEEYRRSGQLDKVIALEEEIEKIQEHLKKARYHNYSRTFSTRTNRDRNSVTVAIRRAFKIIGEKHSSLAWHLHNSIDTGSECRYRPEKEISWSL
jgi:hypothetical protein